MKFALPILPLLLIVGAVAQAQTQDEINRQANNAFKDADKELTVIYQSILKDYKLDTVFVKRLRLAQQAWIVFRDAEVKMVFPDRQPGYYGDVLPQCIANFKEQLTRSRAETLKAWLTGAEQGDVCSGSKKFAP